jgi:competence protein ComEC
VRRPLLVLSAAFAAGATGGGALGAADAWRLLVLAGAALVLAPFARRGWATPALAAGALALGTAAAATEALGHRTMSLGAWVGGPDAAWPVRVSGVAARDAVAEAGRSVLVLDVEAVDTHAWRRAVRGRARIEVGGGAPRPLVVQGDRVRLWASLRPLTGPAGPGLPDPDARALQSGLHAVGYGKSGLLVAVEPRASALARARRWARGRLEAVVVPGPEQGVVKAMVLGERAALDEATLEAFRAAGTYHVLALSGAQVALVAVLVVWGLRRLRVPALAQALGVCAALGAYAGLVGGDVPVVRAAVMAMVVAAGRCLDLDADAGNLLGLAALILMVDRPSATGDVSFQLSFVATLGIVLLTPPLARALPRLPWRLELALATSVAAQAALAPFLVCHFHRLPLAALVLNLVAAPLAAATLLAGAAAAVAPTTLDLAARLGDAAWVAAHALLRSAQWASWAPAADLRLPAPGLAALAAHAAGVVALAQGRVPGAALALAGAALLSVAGGPVADGRLHVTTLDVGQGDALVVRTPAGRAHVVDVGGIRPPFDAGERIVAPALWSWGVRRLETVVVTHAHPDHAGGLAAVLRAFPARDAWEGKAPARDAGYEAQRRALVASGARRRAVSRGVAAEWDGVRVEVLGPRGGSPPWRTRNDDSVVLRLSLGEVALLLTGDVEQAGEGGMGAVRADAVKVAHHGSRSSSAPAFVASTGARAVVISAGARNPFGHPHPEVLERWRRSGALVLRTDRDGAVTFSTDGRRLWVRTQRGGREVRLR